MQNWQAFTVQKLHILLSKDCHVFEHWLILATDLTLPKATSANKNTHVLPVASSQYDWAAVLCFKSIQYTVRCHVLLHFSRLQKLTDSWEPLVTRLRETTPTSRVLSQQLFNIHVFVLSQLYMNVRPNISFKTQVKLPRSRCQLMSNLHVCRHVPRLTSDVS